MKERIKKLIALLMTVLLLNQLPGFETLVVMAEEITLSSDITITADTENASGNTYVYGSGASTITVDSGATVGGVSANDYNEYSINNSGTVNTVTASYGTINLNGGYYGNVTVAQDATVNGNSISAGSVSATGNINFEGTNTVSSLSASSVGGSGAVTVSGQLSLQGTGTSATINVDKNTTITTASENITVYYGGKAYTFEGGTSGATILGRYGVTVSFASADSKTTWTVLTGTDNLNSALLAGETTATYKCTPVEGYYFPENYAVTGNGNATPTVTRVSETELQVSYTVADADSGSVIVTFPAVEKLILDGEGTFDIADITYGETLNPQYSSTTQDTSGAVVEYKALGAEDSTYTVNAPKEVGSYTARVTIPANDDYYELVLTDDFYITKADGKGQFAVADTYYGVNVAPEISSATNSVSDVAVEYKKSGASDLTYTKTKPTAVGSYVARIILPENDTHKSVILTDEFSINYMPVPENPYSLVGTMGSNSYYVSAVTVVAKDGYAISPTLDGEYVGQFTINSSRNATYVYFMDENTGAKSAGVLMSAVNIDITVPNVDADSTKTYYADSLAVVISDANLAYVTVNEEAVTINGNSTVLDLKSNGGVEEYQILVTDRAGNTRTIKVTVAAEWTKTGEIPSGSLVKLEAGQSYTLGSGTWTVSGDSTSYSGGSTFYVGGDGQYTFNQQ